MAYVIGGFTGEPDLYMTMYHSLEDRATFRLRDGYSFGIFGVFNTDITMPNHADPMPTGNAAHDLIARNLSNRLRLSPTLTLAIARDETMEIRSLSSHLDRLIPEVLSAIDNAIAFPGDLKVHRFDIVAQTGKRVTTS